MLLARGPAPLDPGAMGDWRVVGVVSAAVAGDEVVLDKHDGLPRGLKVERRRRRDPVVEPG